MKLVCFRHAIGQFAVRNLLYGPNFKEKAHFEALNLCTSDKRLKLSYKTSINLEDLDFDFVLPHFKLCLFVNEGDEETNSYYLIEEDSSQCLKILS